MSTQWLLLAFLNALPTETTLRVWDLFFVCGARALLASALATLRLVAPPLVATRGSFEGVYSALKAPHERALDADAFMRLVLEELESLSAERLHELRAPRRAEVLDENARRAASRRQRSLARSGAGATTAKRSIALTALRRQLWSEEATAYPRRLLAVSTLVLAVLLLSRITVWRVDAQQAAIDVDIDAPNQTASTATPSRCLFGRSRMPQHGATCRFAPRSAHWKAPRKA